MKAKILIIIVLLFAQQKYLFSQYISIELSVTWEMEYDIFKKDSIVNTPKLNIIYRNNSNSNYYFSKVSDSRDGLPMMPCLILPKVPYYESVYLGNLNKISANRNFNVRIGGMPRYIHDWFVYDYSTTYSDGALNCILDRISEYIFRSNNSEDYVLQKWNFEPSEITPENILESLKDKFVFLKSGEIFIDTYNLVGFKLVEGCFTFFINQDGIRDYVVSDQFDFVIEQHIELKIELPAVVGEYQLFSGGFNTNKITVCFGEK